MSFQFAHSARGTQPVVKVPALGLELTITLSAEHSGGALTIIETVNAPSFGPPLHRHGETEIFRVLEGRYLFAVTMATLTSDGLKFWPPLSSRIGLW